jgi:hypothetical protein
MIDFSLSPLPFVVLSLANFALSWVWYSPLLFAKPWMRALGKEAGHQMSEEERRAMPLLFASGLLSSCLFVYGLMVAVHSLGCTDFLSGACLGALLWLFFVLTHSLNTLWEGRRALVLLINNGLFLLTYAGFGGLFAIWR